MISLNTFKKRIDELGRIVIPKQIRNTFKIKNFDELELYIEGDNIIVKKTGGILLIKDKLDKVLNYIYKYNNIKAFITNGNDVVSSNIIDINTDFVLKNDINNLLLNQEKVELEFNNNIKLCGYVKSFQLINDSVLYGYIVFVSDEKIDNNEIYKDIVNILIDYIN